MDRMEKGKRVYQLIPRKQNTHAPLRDRDAGHIACSTELPGLCLLLILSKC